MGSSGQNPSLRRTFSGSLKVFGSAFLALGLVLGAVGIAPSNASGSCAKVNAVKVVSGSKFVCKKVSGKLTWVKQGSSAVASPKPSPRPSTKPSTAAPTATEWAACKTAGHSVLGKNGMLVCVKHDSKMVWVSYETLDSKEVGMPCRWAGQTAGVGGMLVRCESYPSGKQWATTGQIDPASALLLANSGNFAGGCSLVAANPNAVALKVVYSSITNSNWCIAEIRSSTEVQLPPNAGANQSRFTLTAVGGGGGGGPDGGAGGSGAEIRHMPSILAVAGKPLNVTIGQGGEGGKWSPSGSSPGRDGSPTTVSGFDLTVVAAGGAGGLGWGTRTPNQQTSIGLGLARFVGGAGGYDSLSATHSCNPIAWKEPIAGQDGPVIGVAPGLNYQLAGGGGGGWAYTPKMALNYLGSVAGKGGGAGASLINTNGTLAGSTPGKPGLANTGSGGGGGSACDIPGSLGIAQRTSGGAGGSGVVILAYELAKTSVVGGTTINLSRSSMLMPVIELNGTFVGESTLANIRIVSSWGQLRGSTQIRALAGRLYWDNLSLIGGSTGGVTLAIEIPGYETILLTVNISG